MQIQFLKIVQLAFYGMVVSCLVQACSTIKNAGNGKDETVVKKTGGFKTRFDFVAMN